MAFSYCVCLWAYDRVKIPLCKNFKAKEGMGVDSRWAYFREGIVYAESPIKPKVLAKKFAYFREGIIMVVKINNNDSLCQRRK